MGQQSSKAHALVVALRIAAAPGQDLHTKSTRTGD
jgi:hypothetical protein